MCPAGQSPSAIQPYRPRPQSSQAPTRTAPAPLPPQVRRGFRFAHGKYLRKHTPEHALELAEAFAADGAALIAPGRRVTFLEGYSGALALAAALAAARGDRAGAGAKLRVRPTRGAGRCPACRAAAGSGHPRGGGAGMACKLGARRAALPQAACVHPLLAPTTTLLPPPGRAGPRRDVPLARPRQELEGYWAATVRQLPRGECEVLYGRAGYLFSLLWTERELGPGSVSAALIQVRACTCSGAHLRVSTVDGRAAAGVPPGAPPGAAARHGRACEAPSAPPAALVPHHLRAASCPLLCRCALPCASFPLQEVAADIVQQGRECAAALGVSGTWGVMYQWHDKAYLGAAHGGSGVDTCVCHRQE